MKTRHPRTVLFLIVAVAAGLAPPSTRAGGDSTEPERSNPVCMLPRASARSVRSS